MITTVAQLREALAGFPEDLPVYICDDWIDSPLAAVTLQPAEPSATPELVRPARVVLYSNRASD